MNVTVSEQGRTWTSVGAIGAAVGKTAAFTDGR